MRRPTVTLRALLLVPLLAIAVDQARATLVCGARAESCLRAAGQGWLGAAGIALGVVYAFAAALLVARAARCGPEPSAPRGAVAAERSASPGSDRQPSLVWLWLVGS